MSGWSSLHKERVSSDDQDEAKERPILFSAPMVRAILEKQKTQTRRIMKPQPRPYIGTVLATNLNSGNLKPASYFDAYCGGKYTEANPRGMSGHWCWWSPDDRQGPDWIKCPYGVPGNRLWVRETWTAHGTGVWTIRDARTRIAPDQKILYAADGEKCDGPWWPSIHMPREFSRILLEITDIRAERLQDISKEDAKAEGAGLYVPGHGFITESELRCDPGYSNFLSPRLGFEMIWTEINGAESWKSNPYVWAISFRRIEQERAAA